MALTGCAIDGGPDARYGNRLGAEAILCAVKEYAAAIVAPDADSPVFQDGVNRPGYSGDSVV